MPHREHDSLLWSALGSTEVVIGASLIIGALTLWRTHDWRPWLVPAIAILIETAIFLSIASFSSTENVRQSSSWTWRRRPAALSKRARRRVDRGLSRLRSPCTPHRARVAAVDHNPPLPHHATAGRLRARLYRGCSATTSPTSLQALSTGSYACCLHTVVRCIGLFHTAATKSAASRCTSCPRTSAAAACRRLSELDGGLAPQRNRYWLLPAHLTGDLLSDEASNECPTRLAGLELRRSIASR